MQATSAVPVSSALLFSSIAAVTGPAGSANYAAANAAVDAIAQNMQTQGAWAFEIYKQLKLFDVPYFSMDTHTSWQPAL